jgi:hypothetical protein
LTSQFFNLAAVQQDLRGKGLMIDPCCVSPYCVTTADDLAIFGHPIAKV